MSFEMGKVQPFEQRFCSPNFWICTQEIWYLFGLYIYIYIYEHLMVPKNISFSSLAFIVFVLPFELAFFLSNCLFWDNSSPENGFIWPIFFHELCSKKTPRKEFLVSINCPRKEMSLRRIDLSKNCPRDKLSLRKMFLDV